MINRIMTTRVAALAFAAIPLTAAPALADQPSWKPATSTSGLSLSIGDASFYVSTGTNSWRGRDGRSYSRSRYGQNPWEARQLRRSAVESCAASIQRQGYRVGFRDVDIDDDIRVQQTGRNSFTIRFEDVEFEGRRRELERDISCSVAYGNVVALHGIPQPGSRGYGYRQGSHHNYGYSGRPSWGQHGYTTYSGYSYGSSNSYGHPTYTSKASTYGGRSEGHSHDRSDDRGGRDDRDHRDRDGRRGH